MQCRWVKETVCWLKEVTQRNGYSILFLLMMSMRNEQIVAGEMSLV